MTRAKEEAPDTDFENWFDSDRVKASPIELTEQNTKDTADEAKRIADAAAAIKDECAGIREESRYEWKSGHISALPKIEKTLKAVKFILIIIAFELALLLLTK